MQYNRNPYENLNNQYDNNPNNPYNDRNRNNPYDDRNQYNSNDNRNRYRDDNGFDRNRFDNYRHSNPYNYNGDDDQYKYTNKDYEQSRLDLERRNRVEDANLRRILDDVDKLSSSECYLNVGAQWTFETNVNEATQQESVCIFLFGKVNSLSYESESREL